MYGIYECRNTKNDEIFLACMPLVREVSLRDEIKEGKYTLDIQMIGQTADPNLAMSVSKDIVF